MKKRIILIFTIIACVLSGCQKTPTTEVNTIENTTAGNHYDEANDGETNEVGTTEAWEDMTVVNVTTKNINDTFQVGDKTITFKGTISIPDRTDGLYTYNVTETSYDEYFNNMDFLFGDRERVYTHADEYNKYAISYIDIAGNVRCSEISNQRSYEETKDTIDPVRDVYYRANWNPIVEDSEVPINMSYEEAKEKADEILARIGVKGFEFEKCDYWHYEVFEGNYPFLDKVLVIYRQYLQGVPVISYYGKSGICSATVGFASRGLDSVTITEYEYERIARNDHCLTYEEAFECFKKYVDSCDYYEDAIFYDISFQYVLMAEWVDGKKHLTAVPCYKFDTILETWQRYPDVYVDAVNGKIYSKEYIE